MEIFQSFCFSAESLAMLQVLESVQDWKKLVHLCEILPACSQYPRDFFQINVMMKVLENWPYLSSLNASVSNKGTIGPRTEPCGRSDSIKCRAWIAKDWISQLITAYYSIADRDLYPDPIAGNERLRGKRLIFANINIGTGKKKLINQLYS